MKKWFSLFGLIIIQTLFPLQTFANTPLPVTPETNKVINPTSSNDLLTSLIGDISTIAAPIYSYAITIFTILFLVGIIVLILAILFKNGQWQKFGQGTMFITFIVLLVLRGLPIIALSIKSNSDIELLLNQAVDILGYASIFMALVSIIVSILFRLGYNLIEHPDFHRWSKNLISVSVLMVMISLAVPLIFPMI